MSSLFKIVKWFNCTINCMIIVNLYKIGWKRKITRKELAKAINVSPTTITKLTKGEHVDVKLSTLEKLCDFFECSIHDILIDVKNE